MFGQQQKIRGLQKLNNQYKTSMANNRQRFRNVRLSNILTRTRHFPFGGGAPLMPLVYFITLPITQVIINTAQQGKIYFFENWQFY